MKQFMVVITTRWGVQNLPVTAGCAVDALMAVAERLPFDSKVKVVPL